MKKNIRREEKKERIQNTQASEIRSRLNSRVQELLLNLKIPVCGKSRPGSKPSAFSIGIDIGDKNSRYCILDGKGEVLAEGTLGTTQEEFHAHFFLIPKARIAVEVGTHSPWISALLESYGHTVYVANPRKMESIHKNRRKNDKVDARTLARLVRADPELLYPIRHRGVETREDLVVLRARDALVGARTGLINSMRGLVKSVGERLPTCSADSFHRLAGGAIPERLDSALRPMLGQIESLTEKIREYDKQVGRHTFQSPSAAGSNRPRPSAVASDRSAVSDLEPGRQITVGFLLRGDRPGLLKPHNCKQRQPSSAAHSGASRRLGAGARPGSGV